MCLDTITNTQYITFMWVKYDMTKCYSSPPFTQSSTRHLPDPSGTLTGFNQSIEKVSGNIEMSKVNRDPHSKFSLQTALIHLLCITFYISWLSPRLVLYWSLRASPVGGPTWTHSPGLQHVTLYLGPLPWGEHCSVYNSGPSWPSFLGLPTKKERIGLSCCPQAQHIHPQGMPVLPDC